MSVALAPWLSCRCWMQAPLIVAEAMGFAEEEGLHLRSCTRRPSWASLARYAGAGAGRGRAYAGPLAGGRWRWGWGAALRGFEALSVLNLNGNVDRRSRNDLAGADAGARGMAFDFADAYTRRGSGACWRRARTIADRRAVRVFDAPPNCWSIGWGPWAPMPDGPWTSAPCRRPCMARGAGGGRD